MQFKDEFVRRSEEEYIKDAGLRIDYDEIARKGKMSKEEAFVSKWYGIYPSRQPGDHMARVVIPGGRLTAGQARAVADISDRYARGLVSVTTRQALQFHRLQIPDLPWMLRDLQKAGLSTFHGCGDVTRTIAACPMAETCPHRRVDVLPHAVRTMRVLTDARDLDNLPRKFKITFSGCSASCAQPYMNCTGVIGVSQQKNGITEKGFQIVIGGGMGWKAFVAQPLFGFVPEDRITEVCRGIALLFRDHGDRFNRATSRLKFVVDRLGIDTCREHVKQYLREEGVSLEGFSDLPVADAGTPVPPRPLTDPDLMPDTGLSVVRAIVPKGEITAAHLRRLAELSEIYGNQQLYSDNRQNLAIHGVDPAAAPALARDIRSMGLATEGFSGLTDMVSCVGTTYCPRAVTRTHDLFDSLAPVVNLEKFSGIRRLVQITMTGCPNACAPYRIADIGFRGLKMRQEDTGTVEAYEVLLGGTEQKHGEKLADIRLTDCPALVEQLLDMFAARRQPQEFFCDWVSRTGMDHIRKEVLG